MFTGIVEEMGSIRQIRQGKNSAILTIQAAHVLEGTRIGDSIAVNGICLTVTGIGTDSFTADVMPETLNRSTFAGLCTGQHVNLERAMAASDRFGGHIVAGHVDGTGKIVGIHRDDTAVWFAIQTKPEIMRYIVEKGSVTVDGISLTVAGVERECFRVSAIPHTLEHTTLQERRRGDMVNLENDIIGKYVEKLLTVREQEESRITKEFLVNHGF